MPSEAAVEAEIQAKGLNAPRLTPALVDAQIVAETFFQGADAAHVAVREGDEYSCRLALYCLTICVLVLKNGFTVVGKSACASPENFNDELGRKIAREDARKQVWALEGYRLRSSLAEKGNTNA